MKTIALIGAGKSATVLIDYLLKQAESGVCRVIIADANREQVLSKTNNHPLAEALGVNITDDEQRAALIQRADIVISMMPPALHIFVAHDCIRFKKHLLTASYVDKAIGELDEDISKNGLFFLCEMGLDPGIDHMSAMKIIDEIHLKGGKILSFKSHCGGLVAPESDDNPWHYKISWNPRNVVLAGKAGAIYKINGKEKQEPYESLFDPGRSVFINEELGQLSFYPNRDSLGYLELYGLEDASTFIRTTLRQTEFMSGWSNILALRLTDEHIQYDTDGLSIAGFFKQHFKKLESVSWKDKAAAEKSHSLVKKLENSLTEKGAEIDLSTRQMIFLGLNDNQTLINKGKCSAADVLQFMLENKLVLHPADRDMIVMLHEFEYTLDNKNESLKSLLIVKGEDSSKTAMAKTVGLPLGITAILLAQGKLAMTGLHIPTSAEIYEPVLAELEKSGISFSEKRGN